jgi:hypothetical protein
MTQILHAHMNKIKIFKKAILFNVTYIFNEILIKVPMIIFTVLEKQFKNSYGSRKVHK